MVFADQSGFYLLPLVMRTYAPAGQTPVIKAAPDPRPSFGHERHQPGGKTLHDGARKLL